ncbi:MAG: TolC family protein [Pirellulales bacterium]
MSAQEVRRHFPDISMARWNCRTLLMLVSLFLTLSPTDIFAQLAGPGDPVRDENDGAAIELLPAEPERSTLTLADLEGLALSRNPSVGRAMARVGAARGAALQAGLPPNPSVGYEGQQIGSGGRAEQHGVSFGQEIVRGGKLRLSRQAASLEALRAEQELAAQTIRVRTDVRLAYMHVLISQQVVDLSDRLVTVSRQGNEAVQALVDAQEATRADLLQAQIEVENAEILARNAKNRMGAAWQELQAVVGDTSLPRQKLSGQVHDPPKEFTFDAALAALRTSSPEVAAASAEVARLQAAFERAIAEPTPNVSIQGLVNAVDNGIDGKPDGAVSVSVPIPVVNRNQGGIIKARQELTAGRLAQQRLDLSFQTRLAPVFERYSNARNQVERYQSKILPAAQETLDLTRRAYQGGETNFLSLLTAQRTYFQTNLNFLESLLELRNSEILMEGMLLNGSLVEQSP